MQKCDKVHELPKIPKGLVSFVGKNGVLTCVLYMPDVIDSEDFCDYFIWLSVSPHSSFSS